MTFWQTGRAITTGEYQLIQPIFRHALDYSRIRIYPRRYLPFQAASTAMTPNGEMYYPYRTLYCHDYACQPDNYQALFIHETTHVWQHQMGFAVRRCGLCLGLQGGYHQAKAYHYQHLLPLKLHFSQLNMEQQASALTDYFMAQRQGKPISADLARIMQAFIQNPANLDLLPQSLWFSGSLKNSIH